MNNGISEERVYYVIETRQMSVGFVVKEAGMSRGGRERGREAGKEFLCLEMAGFLFLTKAMGPCLNERSTPCGRCQATGDARR